jgi:hypothetical protein
MSTVQGGQGNIVTNGLVLNLDAANPRSYPMPYNGTTWQNIAPVSSSISGSLINGPTYSSLNGGGIVFDGIDDYVSLFSLNSTSSLSIDFYFRTTSTGIKVMSGMYNSSGADWWIGLSSDNKANWSFGSPSKSDITSSMVVNDGNIRHICCTYDKSINSIFLYINGSLQSSTNAIPSTVTQPGGNATIGRFGDLTAYYTQGNIYNYKIYNRALTPSEVLQNFNATRARFGV